MRRALLIAALTGLLALALTASAPAKEDVTATLTRPLVYGAPAGSPMTVEWTLRDARGRPFDAGDIFAELHSATGDFAVRARAVGAGGGRYSARLRVPRGGISSVVVGLAGVSRVAGARTVTAAPLLFDVRDPFVAPEDGGGLPWPALAGVALALALALATLAARLRAHAVSDA